MAELNTDVRVSNHGSVCMIAPLTQAAREWVAENVNVEGWQWLGNAFACEPRLVDTLVDGMQCDGLVVN